MQKGEQEIIINEKEVKKLAFLKTQSEKSFFLGEYKERVIAGLTKLQIIEDAVYPEIIESIKDYRAVILKMARDVPLKKLKPYIKEAERVNLRYELVDGISYMGDVGLIIAAKDALEEQSENIIIRDMDQDFIDAGLGEIFSKNRGKKIDSECYEKLLKKLPKYADEFKKLNIMDRLLGRKCPICKK
jgi:uncharacterized protein YueI